MPRTENGQGRFSQDFFGREVLDRVRVNSNVETIAWPVEGLYLWADISCGEFQCLAAPRGVLDDRAGNRVCRPSDDATLAEDALKAIIITTVLNERGDDMAFSLEERIEKGLIAKLEHVNSAFTRMDYAEAIRIPESSKESSNTR